MNERRYPVIPVLAESELNRALGYPDSLPADWQALALAKLGQLVSERRGLRMFLENCTRCGACADKCHYWIGTRDPNNMPVARQELLRSVWRRHFTWAGRWFPWLTGARELTRELLDDWVRYFHQCSECRRCSVFCPKGIDTSEITMAGREILASIGISQHYTSRVIATALDTGNNLGLKRPALAQTLESLEEDLRDETGLDIRLPLDDPEAELLLVVPSADFFAEPHVDGLLGYAKVLHQSGVRWTFSSNASEAANFGLFNGNREQMRALAMRLRDAATEVGARRVVIGECGHAWRVAYSFFDALTDGPWPFLDSRWPRPQHICEFTAEQLDAGKLALDPSRNAGKVVTFHDSCNVARGAGMGDTPRGQFTLPRRLLCASVEHFVDMHPDSIGERTFCCGGGGGMLSDDLLPIREAGASPRAEALRAVVEAQGVTHMAAICAICKTQFNAVLPAHALQHVEIVSLHQLVGDALILSENPSTA